jgi:plasmid stability protein
VRKKLPFSENRLGRCRKVFVAACCGCQVTTGGLLPPIPTAIIAINDIIDDMASITIRKLPENTKRRLRIRAARNGRSMEQEARELLEAGLAQAESEPKDLGEAIRRIFAPLGGVDLKIPPRGPIRDPGIR